MVVVLSRSLEVHGLHATDTLSVLLSQIFKARVLAKVSEVLRFVMCFGNRIAGLLPGAQLLLRHWPYLRFSEKQFGHFEDQALLMRVAV